MTEERFVDIETQSQRLNGLVNALGVGVQQAESGVGPRVLPHLACS